MAACHQTFNVSICWKYNTNPVFGYGSANARADIPYHTIPYHTIPYHTIPVIVMVRPVSIFWKYNRNPEFGYGSAKARLRLRTGLLKQA
jgi:hypothetical protein